MRGIINDLFWYQWTSLRPQDQVFPAKPHQIPVLLGCAFAVRRDYYDHIGRNDEQLMIWNGEQIELAFKVHLCGGNMIEVPCSRVCHTFRGIGRVSRNYKDNLFQISMDN